MKNKKIITTVLISILILSVGFIAYRFGQKEKNIQMLENTVSKIPTDWREYKNDLLGFSFYYPKSFGTVLVKISDGEKGQEFRGSMADSSYYNLTFFGGDSVDFSAGRGTDGFDFMGYKNISDIKNRIGFDDYTASSTKKIQEIVTKNGINGVLLEDLNTQSEMEDNMGDFIPIGYSDFFFNLKRFNGGLRFAFDRAKIPEYQEIINSLKIY